MTYLQRRVKHFHKLIGHPHPATPVDDLSLDERRRRARIDGEEAVEKLVALIGHAEAIDLLLGLVAKVVHKRGSSAPGTLDEIAAECIDGYVVNAGTLVTCGIDDAPILEAVLYANDTKVGGGLDANGKAIKPPGWTAPDVVGLLKAQGWRG